MAKNKDELDNEIFAFVTRMKAKKSPFATPEEGAEMYELWNRKFKMTKNWNADKSCSICVSRTFRDLERSLKKRK